MESHTFDPIRRAHFNFMQRLKAAELHETLSQKSKKKARNRLRNVDSNLEQVLNQDPFICSMNFMQTFLFCFYVKSCC